MKSKNLLLLNLQRWKNNIGMKIVMRFLNLHKNIMTNTFFIMNLNLKMKNTTFVKLNIIIHLKEIIHLLLITPKKNMKK